MSHRGRLNVMVNTFRKSASDIFAKFEDVDPRSILGSGDVKYHQGATAELPMRNGASLSLHLVSNPSHLEAVDPIVSGRAKAKQMRMQRTEGSDGQAGVLPITIHGDAAFAGQGIWAETLNLAYVEGFNIGGSIHIIVNNLIGFTAEPEESNSSRFASDIAKRLPIPIFHVNAEDPEAVVRIAALAAEYRYTFRSDVVIDLIGYRRHGHSEVDDPTITQPLRYARIKDHPPLYEIYAKQIGADVSARVKELQGEFGEAQKAAQQFDKQPVIATLPPYWSAYKGGPYKSEYEVETGLTRQEIAAIAEGVTRALLVTGDMTTRMVSHGNRTLEPLFGDAVAVTALDMSGGGRIAFDLGTDGTGAPYLISKTGGLAEPGTPELFMDGTQVMAFSLKQVAPSILRALDGAGAGITDIDRVVLHQANAMMMKTLGHKIKASDDQMVYAIRDYGNTSSASIPLAAPTWRTCSTCCAEVKSAASTPPSAIRARASARGPVSSGRAHR